MSILDPGFGFSGRHPEQQPEQIRHGGRPEADGELAQGAAALGAGSYSYDASGNMTSVAGTTVTFNDAGKASEEDRHASQWAGLGALLFGISFLMGSAKSQAPNGDVGMTDDDEFDAGTLGARVMSRRFRRIVRLLAGAGALALALPCVSACGLAVPSRPEPDAPIDLTVVGGKLAFVQCIAAEIDVNSILVVLSGEVGNDGHFVTSVAMLGESYPDGVVLTQEAVVVGEPIEGLVITRADPYDVNVMTENLAVAIDLYGPTGSPTTWFAITDPSVLKEGKFVSYGGQVADSPCANSSG